LAARRHVFLLCTVLAFGAAAAGDEWPISRPLSGFGANGPHAVVCDSFPSPQWAGKNVYVFHPADTAKRYPLILFCHGIGATHPAVYGPLITNIVSRGHVLVFSPYKSFAGGPRQRKKYRVLMAGFETAVERFATCIDTTKIGIVGHSYGGGAVPAIAWHSIIENQWGDSGVFLYIMAPWYSYFITQEELEAFPSRTFLIMETFHRDKVNDRRMAIDIFDNIAIPDSQKLFVELFGDSMPGYSLSADHSTPTGPAEQGGAENALDFYGVYKFVDAIADYVFQGSAAAKKTAVDTGNAPQRYMGTWPDKRPVRECAVTRSPDTSSAQPCLNGWENVLNPRRSESPTFMPETRKNRFYYTRKTFRNYWDYEKEKIRERRAHRKLAKDTSMCAIPPIEEGFGSLGPWQMVVDSLPQPLWPGRYVHVFSPQKADSPRPVIFFCHGYSSSNPQHYLPLISHIVSKGYMVVFSPYQMVAMDPKEVKKYATLETGLEIAIDNFRAKIDTTKIGFVGHSFGAGAIPAVALWAIVDKNWGGSSAFLYLMAPWYSYEVDRIKLRLFPSRVKLLMEIFAEDRVNDHRMAISLFNTINIPATEKNFIMINSDSVLSCRLKADHNTPKGPFDPRAEEDALDYYGVYRLFDALAAYTFDNDPAAKALVFGHGRETCFMGAWPNGKPVTPLYAGQTPIPAQAQDFYVFPWGSRLNPMNREIMIDK
jgi:pimeloyl-ACP methyl ester carboxylesterase